MILKIPAGSPKCSKASRKRRCRKFLVEQAKHTSLLNTLGDCVLSGGLENILTDINPDHPLGPPASQSLRRHFHRHSRSR